MGVRHAPRRLIELGVGSSVSLQDSPPNLAHHEYERPHRFVDEMVSAHSELDAGMRAR